MSDEGENGDVEKIIPSEEGKINAGEDGKYPEVVPWNKYVGIKETLGKQRSRADTAEGKVTSLEEQLKNATSTEDVQKIRNELEETKGKLKESTDELNTSKEQTLTEKRGVLAKSGVPEEKVKDMSVAELNAALMVLEHNKPGADLGGGGGANSLEGSPLELATKAYTK